MKTTIFKRSIVINGVQTSMSLEDQFWNGLKAIAERRSISISELVSQIDKDRKAGGLSSACRVFVLENR